MLSPGCLYRSGARKGQVFRCVDASLRLGFTLNSQGSRLPCENVVQDQRRCISDTKRKSTLRNTVSPTSIKIILNKTTQSEGLNMNLKKIFQPLINNHEETGLDFTASDIENDSISDRNVNYPVNDSSMDEFSAFIEALFGPIGGNQTKFLDMFPSVCEGIVILASPVDNAETYVEHIMKVCAKRSSAKLVKLKNRELFLTVSAPALLSHLLEGTNYGPRAGFSEKCDHKQQFNLKRGLSHFNTTQQEVNKYNQFFELINYRSNSHLENKLLPEFTVPYPWFNEYITSQEKTPPQILRLSLLLDDLTECEAMVFSTIKNLFHNILYYAKEGQRILLLYEDILRLCQAEDIRPHIILSLISLELLELRKNKISIVFVTIVSPTVFSLLKNLNMAGSHQDNSVSSIFKYLSTLRNQTRKDSGDDPSELGQFTGDSLAPEKKFMISSLNVESFAGKYLGVSLVDAPVPWSVPEQIKKLNDQLQKDYYIANINENICEIEKIASNSFIKVNLCKESIIQRVKEAIEVQQISDIIAVFGLRLLSPIEIERILLHATNIYRQRLSTKDKIFLNPNEPVFENCETPNSYTSEVVDIDILLQACKLVIKVESLANIQRKSSVVINKPKDTGFELPALTQHEEKIYQQCLITPRPGDLKLTSVGGLKKCKKLIDDVVRLPLTRPDIFSKGVLCHSTTGLLIFGPPGTGKTLVCRAVAAELKVNFLNIQPNVINSMWHGESEKNASAVFSLARKIAPCIIFIDEVDSLLSSRQTDGQRNLRSITNLLMQEWDGILSVNERIIVIGTTNRPFDLDEASLRRFPRRIMIDTPDLEERKEILNLLLAEENLGADTTRNELITKVAERTLEFTGSDLKALCIASVLNAVKGHRNIDMNCSDEISKAFESRTVCLKDFMDVINSQQIKPSLEKGSDLMVRIKSWNKLYGMGDDGSRGSGDSEKLWGFV